MRKFGAISLIMIGIGLILVGVYPIIEMNQNLNSSADEWEQLVEDANKEPDNESNEELNTESNETSDETEEEVLLDNTLVGMMTGSMFETKLPIRIGITNPILDQGVGLDADGAMLGEVGNTVLYGHREQIFWGLKDVQLGDEINVQTHHEDLVYEIVEIEIVDPTDPFIYRQEDESVLTLVTCYPFIYMGPITDRYVVKAVKK